MSSTLLDPVTPTVAPAAVQTPAEPDEHQILADAVEHLIDRIYPDFSGGMPRALHRLARAIEQGRVRIELEEDEDLAEILEQ